MTLLERIICSLSMAAGYVSMYATHVYKKTIQGGLPIFVFLTEWVGGNMASDVDDGEGGLLNKKGI